MKVSDFLTAKGLFAAATLSLCGNAFAVAFPGPDTFGYTGTEITNNLRDIRSTGTNVPLLHPSAFLSTSMGIHTLIPSYLPTASCRSTRHPEVAVVREMFLVTL